MSEYEALKGRTEKASEILSRKFELEIWTEYFGKVIAGERCVYVRSTDTRRLPTTEEIEAAKVDLKAYEEKIKALDAQFAAL
jgi:hypothetical protein